ncbi:YdcF family protein [Acinetobacter wanghuae]|uniref:YdcF family protein n=1 Tax=Acinetobacter wanghuae TaxID=2662362 RepID=A0A5Q0P3G6_9GAMM|nr:YdcF family protein [Acinetobacter wanghuae]MQW91440.1 YdcF family protein [Acinetobacter wanghuae]QGA11659.1 YdcF family protein [Acinetobacter wanghuae]
MLHQLKRIFSLVIGFVLVTYSLWLMSLEKMHFGIFVTLFFGIFLSLYFLFFKRIQLWHNSSILRKRIWQSLWAGIWLWLFTVAVFFSYIQFNAKFQTDQQPPQAIIVLGGGVERAEPTPSLRKRLDAAAYYAKTYPSALMIVSGGLVSGESYNEASVMHRYLLQQHPNLKNKIVQEDRSTSTALNLSYSKDILNANSISLTQPIAIVTSDFHLLRAQAIAKHQGYQQIIAVSADTPLYIRYHSWLREYFAYISGWLLNEY